MVAFLCDGTRIISGSFDKSVWVWVAKSGAQLRELQVLIDSVTSVALSSDGS